MEPCWDAGDARNSLEKQLVHGINGDSGSTEQPGGLIPKKKLIQALGILLCCHFPSPGGISGKRESGGRLKGKQSQGKRN